MAATGKPIHAQSLRAKVTSKGQITVPVEIRKSLGVKPGDHLLFEPQEGGMATRWLGRTHRAGYGRERL
jgi:AbrB family looped-hinge helix DNA binding protein